MNRRNFLKIMSASAISAIFSSTSYGLAAQTNDGIESLDNLLSPIRSRHRVPALTAAYLEGEDLIALGATGTRHRLLITPVEDTDHFHIGSCTKSMTATLIAILVEEGRLDWSTTVSDLFPDEIAQILPDYHDVTPIELLAHRAGIPGNNAEYQYQQLQNQYWAYTGPIMDQRIQLMIDVFSRPPVRTPGTAYDYSNLGYIIAGAMAEKVTGQSWEELMNEKLFAPLGMETAGYGAPGTRGEILQPWGHQGENCDPVEPNPFADNAPVLGPAGRVHLSMRDWAKYASLHLLGARGEAGLLLSPSSFERLHQDIDNQQYSLGWALAGRSWANGVALTHAGSNNLWMAVIWIAPNRNAAFFAATNCASNNAFPAVDGATAAMVQRYLL